MKVETKGHTIQVKHTEGDILGFVEKVTNQFGSFKDHNIIFDVSQDATVTLDSIKLFSNLAKQHKKAKKSLVIVASAIDYNAVPSSITVVPTLLEAHDIIEMEEIERDLGF